MWSGRGDRAAEQFAGGNPAWKEGHVIPGTLQNHGEEDRIDRAAVLIHLLGNSCAGRRALAWATRVTSILLVHSIHSQLPRTVSFSCLSVCWCVSSFFFTRVHCVPCFWPAVPSSTPSHEGNKSLGPSWGAGGGEGEQHWVEGVVLGFWFQLLSLPGTPTPDSSSADSLTASVLLTSHPLWRGLFWSRSVNNYDQYK